MKKFTKSELATMERVKEIASKNAQESLKEIFRMPAAEKFEYWAGAVVLAILFSLAFWG